MIILLLALILTVTILPTNNFLAGDNLAKIPIDRVQSLSIKYGWQNPEYPEWQKIYNRLYYGMGLNVVNFHNSIELGIPISGYGFVGFPIVKMGKLEIYNKLQLGVSCNWKVYDEITNSKNFAIGTKLTTYINVG